MEAVLKQVGSCGLYQVIHVFLTQLPKFACVWALFLMVLGGYDPGWRCVPEHTNVSSSKTNELQYHGYRSENSSGKEPHSTTGLENYQYQRMSEISYNGTCDQIDFCKDVEFNPESVTVVTEFGLICDKSWVVRFILLLAAFGGLPASILAGQVGEMFGRRKSVYGFTLTMSVFSGLAIFSPHWSMHAVCSFFIFMGFTGTMTCSNVYSMELLTSKWRGYLGSIPIWATSLLIFTVTIRVLKNWKHLYLTTCVLSLVACVGFFVLPESPRWLMVNKKAEKAKEVVRKIAKINRRPVPNFEEHEAFSVEQSASANHKKTSYSYLDLLRAPELRMHSVKLCGVMFIFNLSYHSLSFGLKSLPGVFFTNLIIASSFDIVLLLATGLVANKVGRRWAGAAMAVTGCVSCLCIVLVLLIPGGREQTALIKFSAFIAKSSAHAIFNICMVCIMELFPTAVRNLAQGLARFANSVGSILAPFLIPSTSDLSFIVTFSILSACCLVDVIIFLSLPETKNECLKDKLPVKREHIKVKAEDEKNGDFSEIVPNSPNRNC